MTQAGALINLASVRRKLSNYFDVVDIDYPIRNPAARLALMMYSLETRRLQGPGVMAPAALKSSCVASFVNTHINYLTQNPGFDQDLNKIANQVT